METRSRDAPPDPASSAAPSTVPPSPAAETLAEAPRRRGSGALKRKASSNLSSSAPSKRLIKERNALNIPSLHNGPCTRARQSPIKEAEAPAANATSAAVVIVDEEVEVVDEPIVDAEFEAVRSRRSDVHVVPTHAGWFNWKEIHPVEKHTLGSFFNGKSESRTPEIYLEIRNTIMRKFHANPQTQLELKDLEEISFGNPDAKQEVKEFLDHWGLINFHPFPSKNQNAKMENPDVMNLDGDAGEDMTTDSLLEKLFQFETVQSFSHLVPKKVEELVPAVMPRPLPESSIAEELVGPVGPSVEYHCNSCSADCSRKRYHCQKQADFDLCNECYKNRMFDSGMAPSDFILMEEPAEGPGVSGGSWTDQETLLLLEALELFGENFNEIAEHVATKTKAQCILHFLQMPIEDPFFEGGNDADDSIPEQTDPGSANTEATTSEVPETKEVKNQEGMVQSDSSPTYVLKEKDANELEVSCETGAGIAIDALKAAFQAIGYMPEQGGLPSFAEAGNPVMALAAFVTHLVEPDNASTSFQSSLKAMSEESPGTQLATRHCFILEDPPIDKKDQHVLKSAAPDTGNGDNPKVEDQVRVANGNDESKESTDKNEDADQVPVANEKCPSMQTDKNPSIETERVSVENDKRPSMENEKNLSEENGKSPPAENEKSQAVSSQDCLEKQSSAKSVLPSEAAPSSTQVSSNPTLPGKHIDHSVVKDENDSASPMAVSSKNPEDLPKTPTNAANETSDLELTCENKPNSMKDSINLDTSMAMDKEPPSEQQESKQKAVTGSTVENAETPAADDRKVSPDKGGKDDDSMGANSDQNNHNINKLKRAAVTVLSAAAVKGKLLADQEEDQICKLVSLIIEKQLHKLEVKLALFADIEGVILKMREQTERARHRLMQERAQIIAARLGLPAGARPNPMSPSTNKVPMGNGTAGFNPSAIASQNPPAMRRP